MNDDIKKRISQISRDRYTDVVMNTRREGVYLVGGYLRDLILGRISPDRDYVVRGTPADIETIAREVASKVNGKHIQLGKRNLQRVILNEGVTLDFTVLHQNIERDLFMRDFTINAMAWSPEEGFHDLYGGISDLMQRKIRMIRRENMMSDPVRIIRAYRLANELAFHISEETTNCIRGIGEKLTTVKSERITLELFKILSSDDCVKTLRMMRQDGILGHIIICSDNELEDKLKAISTFREKLHELPVRCRMKNHNRAAQNLTFSGLYVLEVLMRGNPDHRLSLSSRIQRRINLVEKGINALAGLSSVTLDSLFEAFEAAGEARTDLLIIFLYGKYISELDRYMSAVKGGLVSSQEIKEISGISGGKQLGVIIREIRRCQFKGMLRSREDARQYVMKMCSTII